MSNAAFIIAGVAFALSVIGCLAGFTAITIVVGLKNSTHSIQWKEIDTAKPIDPFEVEEEEVDMTVNPNKRLKVVKDETFADLDNPEVTSNDW